MLKAVITTFTLATSTAAMAQPAPYVDDYNNHHTDRYDDGRYYDSHRNDRDWFGRKRVVVMAENVVLPSNRDQRSTFFHIEAGSSITRMRFDLIAGRSFIDSVNVLFADGHRETLPVRQMLSARNPSVFVDLPPGGIRGFFVNTLPVRRTSGATINIVGLRE